MKCKQIQQKIGLRSEGRLVPEEVTELEKHLAKCPECRTESEADAYLAETLSSLPGLSPKAGGWEKLAERIDAERTPSRTGFLRPVLVFTAAAAVIIAIIITSMPDQRSERSAEVKPTVRKKHIAQKPDLPKEVRPDKPVVNVVELPKKDVTSEPVVKNVQKRAATYTGKRQIRHSRTTAVYKPGVRRHKVIVKHPVPEPGKLDIMKPIPEPANTVIPENKIPANRIADSEPAVQEIAEEMGDFITEGMSALVEASQDLYGRNEEKQL